MTFLYILLSAGSVKLSQCEQYKIDMSPLPATGLSIHTGTVRLWCACDTTSSGPSEPQQNCTPQHIWNFHTEEDAECDKKDDFYTIWPRFTKYKITDLPCLFL